VTVTAAALVAAGAVAANGAGVFRHKEMPLGTKTALRAGETTGSRAWAASPAPG